MAKETKKMATARETLDTNYAKAMKDSKLTTDEKAKAEEVYNAEVSALEVNSARSGKGTRQVVGSTRGKGSIVITYEAFDSDTAGSLPETVAEFMSLSGVEDEGQLVSFLITGFNDASYKTASDPVAEFVNPAWPKEIADSFKLAVKNLVKAGLDIDKVVAMVKPGIDASFAKA